MNVQHTSEKKKLTYLFAGFYIISAALLVLIFTVFWNSAPDIGTDPRNRHLSTDEQLSQADDYLQQHVDGLQSLDKQFAALLLDSGLTASFDLIYNKIQKSELAFNAAIDSVDRKLATTRNMEKLNLIISSYKSVLENRKSIDNMQRGITSGSRLIGNNHQNLDQLKRDLLKKDSSIALLNEQLKQGSHPDRYSMSFPSTDFTLLKNENKYLKSELKLMEARLEGQRNSKASLNEANKAYANMLSNDPDKSSTNKKVQRRTTSYEDNKDQ